MNRMTTRAVTFRHPFTIRGIEGWQPAGRYVIEMEDEPMPALSLLAWRRVHTAIRLPQRPGVSMMEQVAMIDSAEVDAALVGDIAAG